MKFIWNIKQHKTDHKYVEPHHVLLDLEMNTLKKATFPNSPQFCLGYIHAKTITSSQGFKHVNKLSLVNSFPFSQNVKFAK
jgi:hypothetical protein